MLSQKLVRLTVSSTTIAVATPTARATTEPVNATITSTTSHSAYEIGGKRSAGAVPITTHPTNVMVAAVTTPTTETVSAAPAVKNPVDITG